MKQIRNNVFETNSSSTHTLSISSKPIDEIINDIFLRQKENYEPNCYREWCDEKEIIKDGILYINEYSHAYGDECGDDYVIIKSWLPKIMYLGLCVFDCISIIIYDKQHYFNYRGDYSKEEIKKIESNEIYKKYKEIFLNYAHSNNLNVKDIKFNVCKDYYFNIGECSSFYDTIEVCVDKNDISTFETTINKIMESEITIVDGDEAYHPFKKPEITIL